MQTRGETEAEAAARRAWEEDDARLPTVAALVVVATISFLSATMLWGVVIGLVLLGVWR